MSTTFASTYLGEKPHAPMIKSLRISPRSSLKGRGILHDTIIHLEDVELSLDFHIFEIQDFNIMIGHPLEKLFMELPLSRALDIMLGKDTFSIPITRAKNSVANTLPYHEPPKEVMLVSPFESPESSLDIDAKLFIEEEDDLGETIELPLEEAPTRPPIELKPLPASQRYAFLNGDKQAPIIMSDKLTNDKMTKLIAILEKYRSVFGYSLQDLKGINPTLCTHRIPIDPASTPSREPQHRLNNTM